MNYFLFSYKLGYILSSIVYNRSKYSTMNKVERQIRNILCLNIIEIPNSIETLDYIIETHDSIIEIHDSIIEIFDSIIEIPGSTIETSDSIIEIFDNTLIISDTLFIKFQCLVISKIN